MYKDTYTAEQLGANLISNVANLMTHIWGATKTERIAGCEEFIDKLCEELHITESRPSFKFIEGDEGNLLYQRTGGGLYDLETNTVYMFKKFSLTTFLHECRHFLQNKAVTYVNKPEGYDIEEDAREWSCSLYFNADSARYMRAVQNKKLIYY